MNTGSENQTITIDSANARMLSSIDSPRNCLMSVERCAPSTFRSPTSFARSADLAVDILMKLMHAISRMNKTITAKMYM